MKMTLTQAVEMIARNETPEEYEKRVKKLRRLGNEAQDLQDALDVLTEPQDKERADQKRRRLNKVLQMINELK